MRLADYLDQPGRSATALAAQVGVSVSTITRAAKDQVLPSRKVMEDIFSATGGKVTPNDFFGIAA